MNQVKLKANRTIGLAYNANKEKKPPAHPLEHSRSPSLTEGAERSELSEAS